MAKTKPTPAYREICRQLPGCANAKLQDLAAQAQGLLEAREGAETERAAAGPAASAKGALIGKGGKGAAKGHIEEKVIHGCGPYCTG